MMAFGVEDGEDSNGGDGGSQEGRVGEREGDGDSGGDTDSSRPSQWTSSDSGMKIMT